MTLTIEATPKEIADLVLAIQSRQSSLDDLIRNFDTKFADTLRKSASQIHV